MGRFIKRPQKWNTQIFVSVSLEFLEDQDLLSPELVVNKKGRLDLAGFKDSALYKYWLNYRTEQCRIYLITKHRKIITYQSKIQVGWNQDDFIRNMVSIMQRGYSVRVPRFVKNYLLFKAKGHANNVRIMRR